MESQLLKTLYPFTTFAEVEGYFYTHSISEHRLLHRPQVVVLYLSLPQEWGFKELCRGYAVMVSGKPVVVKSMNSGECRLPILKRSENPFRDWYIKANLGVAVRVTSSSDLLVSKNCYL